MRSKQFGGFAVEPDRPLGVRLRALDRQLAFDLDDGAADCDGDGFAIEVDVTPLESAHLATPAAGCGEQAQGERVLRVA